MCPESDGVGLLLGESDCVTDRIQSNKNDPVVCINVHGTSAIGRDSEVIVSYPALHLLKRESRADGHLRRFVLQLMSGDGVGFYGFELVALKPGIQQGTVWGQGHCRTHIGGGSHDKLYARTYDGVLRQSGRKGPV
jgi:hypothetical protein